MSYTPNRQFELDVAEGRIANASPIYIHGECTTLYAQSDVWEGPTSTIFTSASPCQLSIVSTSASDTSAGTGIRTLSLSYVDSSWALQTEDITMNGTSEVNTVATTIRYVLSIQAKTVGSAGAAVGNITLIDASDNVLSKISIGSNISLTAFYVVPANYSLYISSFTSNANKPTTVRLQTTEIANDNQSTVYSYKSSAYVYLNQVQEFYEPPIKVNDNTLVKVTAWGTKDTYVSTSIKGYLIAN